jgi:phosphate transport system substrate-binding protein
MKTAASILALLLVLAAACGEQPEPVANGGTPDSTVALSGEVSVVGSTTVQPLAEVLGESFEALNPGVTIIVSGGGSSVGVKSAGDGSANVGMASRHVKASEFEEFPGIVVHTIANDGIAIVAEPGVTVNSLTMDQCRDIFSGAVTNWNQVGGPNMPIIVVSREEGSGTRGAFEELVLGEALMAEGAILQPSNGAVRTTCSTTPGAVAYLSFGYLDPSVKTISMDGAAPTPENVANGSYPVSRPLNMITNGEPQGVVAAWLSFIESEDGQAIVVAEGYLPIN